jgi:Fic family protein
MNSTSIQPLLPSIEKCDELRSQACNVIAGSAAIAGKLHPKTLQAVENLLRIVNSYYSNLIEGNSTHPSDIEDATNGHYDADTAKRELQLESLAHIHCQRIIAERLASGEEFRPAGKDFLCWVHKEFYDQLPESMHYVTHNEKDVRIRVVGGELRTGGVIVGRHVAPPEDIISDMLQVFETTYAGRVHGDTRIIAAAAAHHRLMWIHPFFDGNGRVARLFTDAYFKSIPVLGYGLWNVSRGLARDRDKYKAMLANTDMVRQGSLDGRGNLSEKRLIEWCAYFLDMCRDQTDYMSRMLDVDNLLSRVDGYVRLRHERMIPDPCPERYQGLNLEAANVIKEVILHGELGRGEAAAFTGLTRKGRDIVGQLVSEKILVSDTPKGPVRLGLPVDMAGKLFPEIYPDKVGIFL